MNSSKKNTTRLIILDRDGVININSKAYIKSAAEWQPIAGSLEAIVQLKSAGFLVAIATNQSGIGRGYYSQHDLAQIHKKMLTALAKNNTSIDQIEFCPHAPKENCSCRKPKPAMLEAIGTKLTVPPMETVFIGDSLKDIQAAKNYGCLGILVRTGYGRETEQQLDKLDWQVPTFDSLQSATLAIINQDHAIPKVS